MKEGLRYSASRVCVECAFIILLGRVCAYSLLTIEPTAIWPILWFCITSPFHGSRTIVTHSFELKFLWWTYQECPLPLPLRALNYRLQIHFALQYRRSFFKAQHSSWPALKRSININYSSLPLRSRIHFLIA